MNKSHFPEAMKVILNHEAAWNDVIVDNPNDPGGITAFGISIKFIQANRIDIDGDGDIDADDIRFLVPYPELAIMCYEKYIWNPGEYDRFNDFYVATKLFDMDVNMGKYRAGVLAQEAANTCGCSLNVDGNLGPKSCEVINSIDPKLFVEAVKARQASFYRNLVNAKPKLAEFLKGWLKRASWPEKT